MSNRHGDLRLLLQLMEGSLPTADRTVLRERFASDRELRRRWDHLNNLPPMTVDDALAAEQISADQVAAFLDGTLPDDAAARFEDESWNSPAVLAELVSLTQSNGVNVVPSELTNRLLSMATNPSATIAQTAPRIGSVTDAISAATSSTIDVKPPPPADQPFLVPTREPSAAGAPRTRRGRRTRTIVLSVMTASFVAVLGWLLWLGADRDGGQQIVRPEQPESLAPDRTPQDIVEDRQHPPSKSPDSSKPPSGSPDPKVPDTAPPPLIRDQPTIVNVPENGQPKPMEPVVPRDTVPTPVKTIDWLEVKGLLAARLSVRDTWRGLDAKPVPVGGNYATFPLTRAIAAGPGGIELVIDQQTEFSELAWNDGVQVRVHQGRIALRNLPDDTRVRILVNDKTFEIIARRDRTTVSFDLRLGEPRVGVQAGVAVINKNKLEKETYYLARQDRTRTVQDGTQFDRWLGTWQASVPIKADLLKALQESNNLRGDLVRMTRNNTLPKPAGDRLVFVVAPQARVHTLLQSRRQTDHDTAIRWLALHPTEHDDIEITAWQNIRRALQSSQRTVEPTIDTMRKWLRGVRGEQAINGNELRRAMNLRQGILKNFAGGCARVMQGR